MSSGPQTVVIVTGRPHVIKNVDGKCILIHMRVVGNAVNALCSVSNRDTVVRLGYQLLLGDWLAIDYADWRDIWLKTDDRDNITIDYWVSDSPLQTAA